MAVDNERLNRSQRRQLASQAKGKPTWVKATPPKPTVSARAQEAIGSSLMRTLAKLHPRRTMTRHFATAFLGGLLIGLFIGGFVAAGVIYLLLIMHRHRY